MSQQQVQEMTVNHQTPWERLRDVGRPPRIMGLDVARALAVIGMMGAHLGSLPEFNIWQPETWGGIVHGRSSILFAVLAGVSIAIMTGRTKIPEPEQLPRLRLSLLGRGVVIFIIGVFLELLGTPVAIILTFYGLLYVIVMPFLRMRSVDLILLGLLLALVGPTVLAGVEYVVEIGYAPGADLVLFGTYPITVWVPLLLVGLGIGRLRLDDPKIAAILLTVGAGVSMVAYALSAAFGGAEGSGVEEVGMSAPAGDEAASAFVSAVLLSYPHSGGTLEIFGSGGFAVALIGLCLLVARPLRWPLIPVACLGAMPLTAYSAHLLLMFALIGPQVSPDSNALWGWTTLGLIVLCTLWLMFFGRGPLESLVRRVSKATASHA